VKFLFNEKGPWPMTQDRKTRWNFGCICVQIWWCGDYECDCTKPEVVVWLPDKEYPWQTSYTIEEGTYCTEATAEEYDEQKNEVLEFGEKYNVEIQDSHGIRYLTSQEKTYYSKTLPRHPT